MADPLGIRPQTRDSIDKMIPALSEALTKVKESEQGSFVHKIAVLLLSSPDMDPSTVPEVATKVELNPLLRFKSKFFPDKELVNTKLLINFMLNVVKKSDFESKRDSIIKDNKIPEKQITDVKQCVKLISKNLEIDKANNEATIKSTYIPDEPEGHGSSGDQYLQSQSDKRKEGLSIVGEAQGKLDTIIEEIKERDTLWRSFDPKLQELVKIEIQIHAHEQNIRSLTEKLRSNFPPESA